MIRVLLYVCVIVQLSSGRGRNIDRDPNGLYNVPVYHPPAVKALFVETFQQETVKPTLWKSSDVPKYAGKWVVDIPNIPEQIIDKSIPGDKYLIAPQKQQHFAISRKLPGVIDPGDGKNFIVQFEFRPLDVWLCSGAYLKFLSADNSDPYTFSGETPYVFMFGPDRCGAEAQIRFIIQSNDDTTGEIVEHHMTHKIEPPLGPFTGLYQLVINVEDNTFEINVDGVNKVSDSFYTGFEPPIQKSTTIDDPKAKRPVDWVTDRLMDDPNEKQPADWDSSAPEFIQDPKAVKPTAWDVDAAEFIDDPSSLKPDDWINEEDGTWIQPQIPNPVCRRAGCGVWTAPLVKNPAYKGKWKAKQTVNPAYKGKWIPAQVPNPDFVPKPNPAALSSVAAIGIELFQQQAGTSFNNIVIGRNKKALNKFGQATAPVAFAIQQKALNKKMGREKKKATEKTFVQKYPWVPSAIGFVFAMAIGAVASLALCTGAPKKLEVVKKKAE